MPAFVWKGKTREGKSVSGERVADNKEAVMALLPKTGGKGRIMAMEILIPSPAIRNLIREDKVHQIYGMMQAGQAKHGMQTFNQSLATLYFQKQITLETAIQRSSMPDELQEMISRGQGLNKANTAVRK